LGQSSLVVLCAGSTLLLVLTPRARLSLALLPKSASNNLQKWFLSPSGRLNLGIITEGKLIVVVIIPSSWGFPTAPVRHQNFSGAIAREKEDFYKGSLSLPIFLLYYFFA
jgi:hypothetical protein